MDFRVRHILDFKMADITAAILVNRAVIAEIPPSGFSSLRVSLNHNKCQISSILESPQEYIPDPGLKLLDLHYNQ